MSLRDYIPQGPVLSEKKARLWLEHEREPVHYLSETRAVPFPIIPLQFFGLRYEEDIVIETTHPDWSMHEYARVRIGDKDVWIAKDSDHAGVQTVTSSFENIENWVAEAPVPRHSSPVDVLERSTPDRIDVTISYLTPKKTKSRSRVFGSKTRCFSEKKKWIDF